MRLYVQQLEALDAQNKALQETLEEQMREKQVCMSMCYMDQCGRWACVLYCIELLCLVV